MSWLVKQNEKRSTNPLQQQPPAPPPEDIHCQYERLFSLDTYEYACHQLLSQLSCRCRLLFYFMFSCVWICYNIPKYKHNISFTFGGPGLEQRLTRMIYRSNRVDLVSSRWLLLSLHALWDHERLLFIVQPLATVDDMQLWLPGYFEAIFLTIKAQTFSRSLMRWWNDRTRKPDLECCRHALQPGKSVCVYVCFDLFVDHTTATPQRYYTFNSVSN